MFEFVVLSIFSFALAPVFSYVNRKANFDMTYLEHAAIAVAIQFLWMALGGSAIAGAAIGSAVFVGREQAQAEKRLQNSGLACGCFWDVFHAFSPRVWHLGDALDVVAPIVATVIVAFFV